MAQNKHHGCCSTLRLREDNARFILLFFVMVFYMLCGAGLFMVLESSNEEVETREYRKRIDMFIEINGVNRTELEALLKYHAEKEKAGFVGNKRARWDFPGSFYFVATVVSTIGEYVLASTWYIYNIYLIIKRISYIHLRIHWYLITKAAILSTGIVLV